MRDNGAQLDALHVAHGLIKAQLARGEPFRLEVATPSMSPALRVGDRVVVRRVEWSALQTGDIVLCEFQGILLLHRFIRTRVRDGVPVLVTKGDAAADFDSPSAPEALLGRVERIERGARRFDLREKGSRRVAFVMAVISAMIGYTAGFARKLRKRGAPALWLGIALVLLTLTTASAAVTISSFTAADGQAKITLSWTTASELKNFGFNVERSANSADPSAWAKIGFVGSKSPCVQSLSTLAYTYTDSTVQAGVKYYYRLQLFGAPCGDPNVYHDTVVSATAAGAAMPTPTATPTQPPTATPVPSATPTQPPTATPVPSATPTPLPAGTAVATTAAPVAATATRVPDAPTAAPDAPRDPDPNPTATAVAPVQATAIADAPAVPTATVIASEAGGATPVAPAVQPTRAPAATVTTAPRVARAVPTDRPASSDGQARRSTPRDSAPASAPAPVPSTALLGIGLVTVFGMGGAGFLLFALAGFILWYYYQDR